MFTVTALCLTSLLLAPQAGAKDAKKPAPTPQTLNDLMSSFDEQEQKAQKELREKRFAAIEAYLAAKTPPSDRKGALSAAAELGFELEKWEKALAHSEKFLADFKSDAGAPSIMLTKARCLTNMAGKEAAAKDAYRAAIEAAGKNINLAVEATTELADALATGGDVDGAKKALDECAEKYKDPGLKQYLDGMKGDFDIIGTEPTPINVKGLDGKPLSLESMKGKVVLIDFWATWCGPCMAELPNVLATYKKYHDKGFEILGISLDRAEDEQKLKDTMAAKGMTWPQYYDGKFWKNEVAVAYGIQSIPATYLLDRNGKIIRKGLRGPALGNAVAKALAAPAKQ